MHLRIHTALRRNCELDVLPKYEVAPPVTEWEAEDVAIGVFHHLVYIGATALAYEWLSRDGKRSAT